MEKKETPVLAEVTKLGLTFGQLLSVIGLFGGMITVWVSVNVRIAATEIRIEQLEKGRIQNAVNIETFRKENREDFTRVLDKLDAIMLKVNQ